MAKILDKIIPKGTNSQNSLDLYTERKEYKDFAYADVEDSVPLLMDLWYDKALYGKVDLDYNAIYLKKSTLKKLASNSSEVFAVNFVADAFNDLREFMYIAANKGKIVLEDTKYLELEPTKGYQPIDNLYFEHLSFLYSGFVSEFLVQKKREQKLGSFKDFMMMFQEYLIELMPEIPITQTGFILSSFNPIYTTGVVIEIADEDHGDDEVKYNDYIEDDNFIFFAQAANKFGFKVDKNAPWRLIADLKSDAMQEYMSRYPARPERPPDPGDEPQLPDPNVYFSASLGKEFEFPSQIANTEQQRVGTLRGILSSSNPARAEFDIIQKPLVTDPPDLTPVSKDPVAKIYGYDHYEERIIVTAPPRSLGVTLADANFSNKYWYVNKPSSQWGILLSAGGSSFPEDGVEPRYIWSQEENSNGDIFIPAYLRRLPGGFQNSRQLRFYPDRQGEYRFSLRIQYEDGRVSEAATATIRVCQQVWTQGGKAVDADEITSGRGRTITYRMLNGIPGRDETYLSCEMDGCVNRNKFAFWHWLYGVNENGDPWTNEIPPGMWGWLTQFSRVPVDPTIEPLLRNTSGQTARQDLLQTNPSAKNFLDGYRGNKGCWFPYVLKNNIGHPVPRNRSSSNGFVGVLDPFSAGGCREDASLEGASEVQGDRDELTVVRGPDCVKDKDDPNYREWCELDPTFVEVRAQILEQYQDELESIRKRAARRVAQYSQEAASAAASLNFTQVSNIRDRAEAEAQEFRALMAPIEEKIDKMNDGRWIQEFQQPKTDAQSVSDVYWDNWQRGNLDYLKDRFDSWTPNGPFVGIVGGQLARFPEGYAHGDNRHGGNGCPSGAALGLFGSRPERPGTTTPLTPIATVNFTVSPIIEELKKQITDFSTPEIIPLQQDRKVFFNLREDYKKRIEEYPMLYSVWLNKLKALNLYNQETLPNWEAEARITFDNLFRKYYVKSFETDVMNLKENILNLYNSYVIQNPVTSVSKPSTCGDGTITKVINRQMITRETMNNEYKEFYWFQLYGMLRSLESGLQLSTEERRAFDKKIKYFYQANPELFQTQVLQEIDNKTKKVFEEKIGLTRPKKSATIRSQINNFDVNEQNAFSEDARLSVESPEDIMFIMNEED